VFFSARARRAQHSIARTPPALQYHYLLTQRRFQSLSRARYVLEYFILCARQDLKREEMHA
jgi:hypothetical protein